MNKRIGRSLCPGSSAGAPRSYRSVRAYAREQYCSGSKINQE